MAIMTANSWCRPLCYVYQCTKLITTSEVDTILVPILQLNFAQGHTTSKAAALEFRQPAIWLQFRAPNHYNMQVTRVNGPFYIQPCLDLKGSKGYQQKAV